MNQAVYRKNEILRSSLAETMQLNHVQLALEAVRELGEPTEFPVPSDVDFLAFNALQNARREGYFHAIRAFETLAKPLSNAPLTKDLMPSLVDD